METKKKEIKKLYRSNTEKILGGVCGGIGEHLEVDPTLIRLLGVLIIFLSGILPGILIYVIMWIIVPENPNQ